MTAEPAKHAPPPHRQSRVVVPHKLNFSQRLLASTAYVCIRLVNATLRFRWRFPDSVLQEDVQPAIFCVWHNRLAIALNSYRSYARQRQQPHRMAAMVSASKDGAIVARVLEHFGVEPVRGSSSRRGPQALLEMIHWAERGYDLAVTPDGPRGPRYHAQEGVVYLAQLTGLPIIPASAMMSWKKCAKSWDGFQLPLPFSRIDVRLADPIRVARDATTAEIESIRQKLEDQLKELGGD